VVRILLKACIHSCKLLDDQFRLHKFSTLNQHIRLLNYATPYKKKRVHMKTVAWTWMLNRWRCTQLSIAMFVKLPHQTALIWNITDSHTKHTKTLCYPLSDTKRWELLNTVINYTMADIFCNMANNAYPCITHEQPAVILKILQLLEVLSWAHFFYCFTYTYKESRLLWNHTTVIHGHHYRQNVRHCGQNL